MTHRKRLDTLEAQACRLACARLRLPPGYDVDRFLDAAIAWLQKPFDQLCAEFPMFTEAEIGKSGAMCRSTAGQGCWGGGRRNQWPDQVSRTAGRCPDQASRHPNFARILTFPRI